MKRIPGAAVLAFALGTAHAATFNVTNLNDSGAGSLRDAVAQANANPGPDQVTFSVVGTIVLTSGQININGSLGVVGPGSGALTLDGNANSRIFSIFENVPDVCATPNDDFVVSISGLTLNNGRQSADGPGGAIYSEKTLWLKSMVIANSLAKEGGGVAISARYEGQTFAFEDSQIIGNSAAQLQNSTSGTNGGGLLAVQRCAGAAPATTLWILRSVFSGNRAVPTTFPASGAGIFIAIAGAAVNIADSRFIDNVIVAQVPVSQTANNRGAGIAISNAGSTTIERTEISGNTADRNGGLRLTNNQGTVLTAMVVNSTISGNVAVSPPAGAAAAIAVTGNVALQIYNSTVGSNVALSGSAVGINLGAANGLVPSLTVQSSILSNSALAADVEIDFSLASLIVSASQSLIGLPGLGITVTGSGNLFGVDPMAGPLAFNGGGTRTHELLLGSPAIAAGSNPLVLNTDQRGFGYPRTLVGKTDMGAFQSAVGSVFSRNYVQKAYVAYYGRPAEPAGQDYWAKRMDDEGQSLASIIAAFGNSDEFNRRYGGLTAAQLITKIYQQALARGPDQGGLDYYVGELNAGRRTLQSITLDVLNGASTAPDSTVVANKLAVADHYTAMVALGCPYGGEQLGVDSIAGVTANPATVSAAIAAIDSRCST